MNYTEDGIYVSYDHGVTWVQANTGIPESATVYSLVVKGPDVLPEHNRAFTGQRTMEATG
ncbi:MAG: hypothetical protein IPF68_16465 [Bacteroidales bacterium]|nr:hypothetical protein [Bacteroidales bacterium]